MCNVTECKDGKTYVIFETRNHKVAISSGGYCLEHYKEILSKIHEIDPNFPSLLPEPIYITE